MTKPPVTSHDTRRRWRLAGAAWAPTGRLVAYDDNTIIPEGFVKGMRLAFEPMPGEITITREELNAAWTKVKGDFMHPDCADLEDELFGQHGR